MTNCLCGKPATHVAYFPVPNAYAGLRQIVESVLVCDYHAEKARKGGYEVQLCKQQNIF